MKNLDKDIESIKREIKDVYNIDLSDKPDLLVYFFDGITDFIEDLGLLDELNQDDRELVAKNLFELIENYWYERSN